MVEDGRREEGPGGWTGSAADLEEVLRFAADPITVQDARGRLVYANEAAARQVGFATAREFLAAPIEEVLGRYELLDEAGRPLRLDALPGRRALQGEREPEAIVGFRIKGDPGTRWSIVQATPVLHGGRVRYVINAFQDITRLKRVEDRLRVLADAGELLAASTDYQATLQSLADLVVPRLADWCVVDIVDAGGLHRVAVAHPDPAKRAMAEDLQHRYPPALDQPGGVSDVIRTGESQIAPDITDEMLVAAARDEEHVRLIRSLGLRSAAIVPLVARGQILGALTLAAAESGHRYSEADRPFLEDLGRRAAVAVDNARLLDDAQEAVRARDEFLAMASHDMRTPLQAILGNIQLAIRRLEAGDGAAGHDGRIMRNLAQAERTTERLARLVGDLLDIVMLSSGNPLPLELEPVRVYDVAERVASEHQAVADGREIRVIGARDAVATVDVTRLERVVDNLLENAIKYSPEGSQVTLEIDSDATASMIRVRDHGMGIPEAERAAIFEPFHRASNAAGLRGIGLGLSGARSVVRQLGGEITVDAGDDGGSVFTVRLPRE